MNKIVIHKESQKKHNEFDVKVNDVDDIDDVYNHRRIDLSLNVFQSNS